MIFDEYLVYDGEHEVSKEVRRAEKETGKDFSLLGKGAVHKIYQFPNGYSVSVVKGSFTMDMWEMMIVEGDTEIEKPGIFQDIIRFNNYSDVVVVLGEIYQV